MSTLPTLPLPLYHLMRLKSLKSGDDPKIKPLCWLYLLHNRQGQFSGTHDLILALKSFTDCNFLHSSGKIFHNLGPKYNKDSDPYRTVFIRRAAKLELFLRSYSQMDSVVGKTLFIISGEKLLCTLNISVTNTWRFFTWMVTELFFSKSSLKVDFYFCKLFYVPSYGFY